VFRDLGRERSGRTLGEFGVVVRAKLRRRQSWLSLRSRARSDGAPWCAVGCRVGWRRRDWGPW
jgi:hypothetical protein